MKKQRELLESVRNNEACIVLANSFVEAVVLRRYSDGRVSHIRVDDQTPDDLDIPSDCNRMLVVIEMQIEESFGTRVGDALGASPTPAQQVRGDLHTRSVPPLS